MKKLVPFVICDGEKCIGCKTCLAACPFGAADLILLHKKGKFVFQTTLTKPLPDENKCDSCVELAGVPVCIEKCPQQALFLLEPRKSKKEKNIKAAATAVGTLFKNRR